jgi:heptosyltransferase II
VKKILIIGPAWVGDMVMAQTLFQCLLQQEPTAEISVLAPTWCRELLVRMPEVKHALSLPLAHGELGLGKRWRIARDLAQQQFNQVIVLPNSFKSALIARFAGIPQRTGWRGEARGWLLNDCRPLDKLRYPLMVQRFAALAYAPNAALPANLPKPRLHTDANAVAAVLSSLQLTLNKPVLALCPGAEFGPSKQWPAHYYAAVAQHFLQQGMQVWLFGSVKDAVVAQAITALAPAAINLCGGTTLGQAVDLLGVATAVVSNDSGLMHVAAALARPLVVVYGSTSPAFTPPLADQVAVLSEGLACSPCFKRECPLEHLNCLQQLGAPKVIAAVEGLLASSLFLEH